MSNLQVRPITLREANEFVIKHHRHHKPTTGHKFSISCLQDGVVRGVRYGQVREADVIMEFPRKKKQDGVNVLVLTFN